MEPWKQYQEGPWVVYGQPKPDASVDVFAQDVANKESPFISGFKRGIYQLTTGLSQRVGEPLRDRQLQRVKDFADKLNSGEIQATPENIEYFDQQSQLLMDMNFALDRGQSVEAAQRESFGAVKEESPVRAIGGNIAGQVVGTATGAATLGIGGAPTTLAGRMATGVEAGAATGALQPTIGDESAVKNTVIGGILGGLAPPILEKAVAPVVGAALKFPASVYNSVAGKNKQKVIDLIEKRGDAAEIERISANVERAGKKVVNGKLVDDIPAQELMRQGVDDLTVSMIQSSSKADKHAMREALEILKQGKKNLVYAKANRPGDAAGKVLKSRYDAVNRINKRAGAEVEKAAKGLEGKQVNIDAAYDDFINQLQDAGVSIVRGEKGSLKGVYTNSEFALSKSSQKVLNEFISRSEKGTLDAGAAHRLKRIIDSTVEYGKKSKDGILGKSESLLKELRSNINGSLQELSPAYKAANEKYADTKTALDAFKSIAGTKFNPGSENADKQLVNVIRTLMSNNQNRAPAMDAIEALQQTAKKYGDAFDDDILKQAAFMDELETIFGSSAPTSFGGQIEKAVSQATSGDTRGLLVDTAKAGLKKLRGINEEKLIKALEELLSE